MMQVRNKQVVKMNEEQAEKMKIHLQVEKEMGIEEYPTERDIAWLRTFEPKDVKRY